MINVAKQESSFQFYGVAHASEQDISAWSQELHLEQLPSNVTMVSDPDRTIYAAYGIGGKTKYLR